MAKKSKRSKRPRQNSALAKPYPEFPLTPHPSGRWRKIHRGKTYYFGPLDDWAAALEEYERTWPFIISGRAIPDREANPEGIVTLLDGVNAFLVAKRTLLDNGELSPRTFAEHMRTCDHIVKAIPKTRDIETIGPDDFARLRASLAKRLALLSLGIAITRCRSVFKFLVDSGLRDSAVRYGASFARPTRKAIRVQRRDKGSRAFTAKECRDLIRTSTGQLNAMVLLALNAGLGNTDIGGLRHSHIDLDAGIVSMPRAKTGITRRAVLWPATVEAVRTAIATRPTPKLEAEGLVFVTKYGRAWARSSIIDDGDSAKLSLTNAVGAEFGKLATFTGIGRGRGFYSLRHSFRTAADSHPDRPAVDVVMGHADDGDMRSHYVDITSIDDDRLRAVADHVRAWLEKGGKA